VRNAQSFADIRNRLSLFAAPGPEVVIDRGGFDLAGASCGREKEQGKAVRPA
jgi:hypothetical protein